VVSGGVLQAFTEQLHCRPYSDAGRLPYLTLPFGAGILPPSAEASSGPNVHPRINPKVIETFYRFLQTSEEYSSVLVLGHLVLIPSKEFTSFLSDGRADGIFLFSTEDHLFSLTR